MEEGVEKDDDIELSLDSKGLDRHIASLEREIGNPQTLQEFRDALIQNENFRDLQMLDGRGIDVARYIDGLLRGTTRGRRNTMSDPAKFLRKKKILCQILQERV